MFVKTKAYYNCSLKFGAERVKTRLLYAELIVFTTDRSKVVVLVVTALCVALWLLDVALFHVLRILSVDLLLCLVDSV